MSSISPRVASPAPTAHEGDILRRCNPVALAVLVALIGALSMTTPAQPARAAALVRPNLILVLTDDQTLESLSHLPYVSGHTDWYRFTNYYLNVSLCCPSRAAILTGQTDLHNGITGNNGKDFKDANTLATWLKSGGYRTSMIGKYLNGYPWSKGSTYVPPGWDDWHVFEHNPLYYNYTLNENKVVRSYGSTAADYSTDVLAARARSFISSTTQPFFLEFAPKAPHLNPHLAPPTPSPAYSGVYVNDAVPTLTKPSFNRSITNGPAWERSLATKDAVKMATAVRAQWETLRSVDDAVKSFDNLLAARGIADDTVMVFTSDNGYSFGEHKFQTKRCEYDECAHVPLLIRYPGGTPRKIANVTSNLDLASTFAELAGVTPGLKQDGRSLVPLLKGTATSWRDSILIHWKGGVAEADEVYSIPEFFGIRTPRYTYVELVTGEKELYDHAADPYELNNKAGDPAYASVQANQAGQLAALKKSLGISAAFTTARPHWWTVPLHRGAKALKRHKDAIGVAVLFGVVLLGVVSRRWWKRGRNVILR
jgi:N-acetylglucosamine-6-sulfatase